MKNVYLEVSIHENGFEIYDHTHYVEMFEHIGSYQEVADMRARYEFHRIEGKVINYHVMGLKSYEQSKQFAIWYHTARASGIIRTHRLDIDKRSTPRNAGQRKKNSSSR